MLCCSSTGQLAVPRPSLQAVPSFKNMIVNSKYIDNKFHLVQLLIYKLEQVIIFAWKAIPCKVNVKG